MVGKLNCLRIQKMGEGFKVPYHASAAAVYNGNMPYMMANRLTQRQFVLYNNYLLLFPTVTQPVFIINLIPIIKSKKLPDPLIFNKNQNNFCPFITKLYFKFLINYN
jgi:hypothetical protein